MRGRFLVALFSGCALCCAAAAPAHATLIISTGKTVNVDCESGVCNATAADAVLNVTDLANMLAVSDIKVFAEGAATEINVSDPFSWTSASRLTLGANGSVSVKAAITVAGPGGLTIITNVAQLGGVFKLVGTGKVMFWDTSSSLIINNVTYTLINNLPGLANAIASNPSGDYALANDYDASQDGTYAHSPIPTTFAGAFEGLGNAVSNLSIYNPGSSGELIGLFTNVGASGQLNDVNLVNIAMQATGAYLASLVETNTGTITHCSASGSITALTGGNFSAAGLVVDNQGTITRSHTAVNMDVSAENVGGLAVSNEGTISLSDAAGPASAGDLAGGLVAYSTGAISLSFATGNVAVSSGAGAQAGGLVGNLAAGSVAVSFATGAVHGGTLDPKKKKKSMPGLSPRVAGNALGGLVGVSNAFIESSYETGSVSQGENKGGSSKHASVGGVVGATDGASRIVQAYAVGKLSLDGRAYIGGVIGSDASPAGNNVDDFWDLNTTGVKNKNQGAGNAFDDEGLKGFPENKFREKTALRLNHSVWGEDPNINNGYPYLLANPPQ